MSLDTAARMQDVPSGKSIAAAPRPLFGQTLDGRVVLHDIEHLVTGFGPNPAGEVALALCNVAATARYFTPASAQYFSHATYFVSTASFARASLHYHGVLPTYFEAMQKGIAVGLALEKPLFLVEWEECLDWQLDDIAAHLGFARGPAQGWDWTTEATTG
jgi:ubiquinone biosynthesis protein Coq4